jgi:cytochrome c oxidase assembly protein subunit 11
MCKSLGINGKTSNVAYDVKKNGLIDKSRWVTVEFMTMNASGVPWKFKPSIKKVKIHPGEMKRLSFYAENFSDKPMIVQAIPSVAPGVAAKYFKKTECFCFTQQQLNAHEAMDMPLLFHLDVELPKEISTVTLSYTLFDVTARMQRKNS